MLSSKCNPELVKNIIDRFKKELGFIDIFNKKGLTPLLNLCCNIDQFDNEEWPVQIIELLVNAGADVNVIVNHDIILQLGGQFPNILLKYSKPGLKRNFRGGRWCKILKRGATFSGGVKFLQGGGHPPAPPLQPAMISLFS